MNDHQGAAIACSFLADLAQRANDLNAAAAFCEEGLKRNLMTGNEYGCREMAAQLAKLMWSVDQTRASQLVRQSLLFGLAEDDFYHWVLLNGNALGLKTWERERLEFLRRPAYIRAAIQTLQTHCTSYAQIPLWHDGPTGTQHWDALVRAHQGSNRGSDVAGLDSWEKTRRFLESLPFIEVEPEASFAKAGCRYFHADLPPLATRPIWV